MHKLKNYKVIKNISICVLVFLTLTLVCLLSNLFGFYKHFLLGTFGLMIYPIVLFGIAYNVLVLTNRFLRFNPKSLSLCLTILIFFICILHTALTSGYDSSTFGAYIAECYNTSTVGGVIVGSFVYLIKAVVFEVGAYVVFSIGLIVTIAMIIDSYYDKKPNEIKKPNAQIHRISIEKKEEPISIPSADNEEENKERNHAKELLGLNRVKQEETLDASDYLYGRGMSRNEALSTLYPNKNTEIKSQNPNYLNYSLDKYIDNKPNKILHNTDTPKKVDTIDYAKNKEYMDASRPQIYNQGGIISGDNYAKYKEELSFVDEKTLMTHNNILDEIKNEDIIDKKAPAFIYEEPEKTRFEAKSNTIETMDEMLVDHKDVQEDIKEQPDMVFQTPQGIREIEKVNTTSNKPTYILEEEPKKIEPKNFTNSEVFKHHENVTTSKEVEKKPYRPKRYRAPSLEYLTTESSDNSDLIESAVKKKDLLEYALENFRIPAKVSDVVVGPAVTRYEIMMPPGISVKKVLGYSDDIAMALEAKGDVRIEAPIPGKSVVGVEVPNDSIAVVGLKEVLGSKQFTMQKSPLTFVLGKDISGEYRFCDLQDAPHLLVAGSTGSGKSVCLNTLIISLLYRCSPEDLRLILVDPKRVEFATYSGIPHLMMPSIINDPEKALNAFNWAVNEMERRYMLFEQNLVRDIGEYNQMPQIVNKEAPKMPYIVMIVDELAELMTINKKDFEERISRLSAKSRSAGIHLVLATQRPSVDVITGVIKNNLPSRIAFAVTSGADSKTILDQGGAEKLLGKGDMLFWPRSAPEPSRIQGTFINNREIMSIVKYIKENNVCEFEENIEKKMTSKNFGTNAVVNALSRGEEDELFPTALKIVIESGRPSKTYLQRCLRLGFSRAANLIDAMEQLHYITPAENGKKGEVFITMEEFIQKYGEI